MTRISADSGREKTAERLLKSSAARWYDPEIDIDWNAPLAEGKWFIVPRRSTLYGTDLWDRLTVEARIELSKHELASSVTNGIWFELLLMRILVDEVYDKDPTTRHAQYALTEIADECRHSIMFARMTERIGCPPYGPLPFRRRLGKLLPLIGYGPVFYAAILVAEEILDRLQREMMHDEEIQPLVRMVNRIHVLEEARHMSFAREELLRGVRKLSKAELVYQRELLAIVAHETTHSLVHPHVYASVGIRPRDGYRAAWRNPNWHETLRYAGERLLPFLEEAGLVGAPAMRWWRRSGLVGAR